MQPSLPAHRLQRQNHLTITPYLPFSMRVIMYYVIPQGLDTYWTTALELYCYLYSNKSERTRLQTMINQLGGQHGQQFIIYHRCDPFSIRLTVGQTDESFLQHIECLLQGVGFVIPQDYSIQGISAALCALS